MLGALRAPIAPLRLLAGAAAVTLAVALYCLAYTALAGRPETLGESLGWALVNVSPWLIAIEGAKRARSAAEALLVLLGAGALSLALGALLAIGGSPLAFEAVRRIPAFFASAAAVALLRSGLGRPKDEGAEIPLLPRQIDWVRAAGNYVELKAGEQTVVHRGSIGAAERDLASHGFVRIHRSILVRRDRIARVRPADVVLADGTHLKVGKRYRAALTG